MLGSLIFKKGFEGGRGNKPFEASGMTTYQRGFCAPTNNLLRKDISGALRPWAPSGMTSCQRGFCATTYNLLRKDIAGALRPWAPSGMTSCQRVFILWNTLSAASNPHPLAFARVSCERVRKRNICPFRIH
jgi:hypothetical protein